MSLAADLCLAGAVVCVWLACLGFFRLATPLDRLHCTTFVSASAGAALAAASFLAEGVTSRSVKLVALLGISLLAGAAIAHASGRALWLRDGPRP